MSKSPPPRAPHSVRGDIQQTVPPLSRSLLGLAVKYAGSSRYRRRVLWEGCVDKMIVATASIGAGSLRYPGAVAVCILLAATLLACTGGGEDSARDERVLELEAKVDSLEESVKAQDARLQELEEVASKVESVLPAMEQWSKGKDEQLSLPEGTALERTVRLAEDSGGDVDYVDHPERRRPLSVGDASGIC